MRSYPCYREPTKEREGEITKRDIPAFTSDKYASDDGWMDDDCREGSSTERQQVMVVLATSS
jgi:hypothetical protein